MTREAVVIGGGLSGSTLAIRLAEEGRDVLLLEKSAAAEDKMCGEFFSREALHYLARLGVDPVAFGAVAINGVRLAQRRILAESALPFQALSLTRRVLDEALLARAVAAGAEVRRGVRAQALDAQADGWIAKLPGAREVRAKTAFLATGKYDLHGWQRRGGRQNDLVAFKMYFRLAPAQIAALGGFVELILFPGGYAGLQPVERGVANLCLLVTRARLKQCDSSWAKLLEHMCATSPHLALRLQGAVPTLARPLALSSIPYGYLPARSTGSLWRVGDQAAVIPSFSGDGMSIALHSAHVAADLYLRGKTPQQFAASLSAQLRPGVGLATTLSRLLVAMPAAAHVTRLWPGLLRRIVTATRVPDHALLR